MSGFVGIVNLDGAPVERELLERLTDFLAFRGPDARAIWLDGPVGFGHTLLKTTFESERERQPMTLDGQVWITADARVDGRAELIQQLVQHGGMVVPPVSDHGQDPDESGQVPHGTEKARQGDRALASAPDVELILHAYHAWGIDSVEHLIGDFAFAIWDGRERRLFCARDHMGVKPFYYAQVGNCVVFSNTLDCVRLHPAVSDKLNEQAVADFLLFEGNKDPATTTFADIRRLPPAHRITWNNAGPKLSRYWTLPIDEPVFYRRAGDYVDRFKELLRQGVTDRLRTRRVGIFMSGGLDSPTLAATTRDLLRERYRSADLKAFTTLVPHGPDECYYARLVADRLGIPIHFQLVDFKRVAMNWECKRIHTPEPIGNPWDVPADQKYWQELGAYSRVFFYGEGPDNALRFEWQPYFRYLTRQCRGGKGVPPAWGHGQNSRAIWYGRLVEALFYIGAHGPIPFLGRIPRRIKRLTSGRKQECKFPPWISDSLESRLDLRASYEDHMLPLTSAHPVRPKGYASMLISLWQDMFESQDAGWTMAPVEVRHPYVDLRMLRFLLAVPALPWCRSKYLLRRAMRGVLPGAILRRPKQGVPDAPIPDWLAQLIASPFALVPEMGHYVAPERLPKSPSKDIWVVGDALRVRGLNYWLNISRKRLIITPQEDANESARAEECGSSFGEKAIPKAVRPDIW